ncbi:MAG: hypothetical protein AVDCRST_MAG54-160, partial [uncultured Actinomycetospora sp.]
MQGPAAGARRAADLLGEVGHLARGVVVARGGAEADGEHERRPDGP